MDIMTDYKKIYKQYYEQIPEGINKYTGIRSMLFSLGDEIKTLYDFLNVKQGTLGYDGLYLKAFEKKENLEAK